MKRETVLLCLWRVSQVLELIMCSIGRIEAAGWCSSSEHPGSWHLHWLIQKRGSSRLLFQTRKIFSPPKGVGGCAVRISVVFLTPASWCLWKQGPESKGWSWTMRGWELYEAPSDHWISVLIGNQSRSFHTRSASVPSSSGSPAISASVASLTAFLAFMQSSAHAAHVCPTASLASQGWDLPFHGHRDSLFMQRTRPVSEPWK